MGVLSLPMVLAAELGLSPFVRGSLQAWFDSFTPVTLSVALLLRAAHAVMPALLWRGSQRPLRGRRPGGRRGPSRIGAEVMCVSGERRTAQCVISLPTAPSLDLRERQCAYCRLRSGASTISDRRSGEPWRILATRAASNTCAQEHRHHRRSPRPDPGAILSRLDHSAGRQSDIPEPNVSRRAPDPGLDLPRRLRLPREHPLPIVQANVIATAAKKVLIAWTPIVENPSVPEPCAPGSVRSSRNRDGEGSHSLLCGSRGG